MNIPPLIKFDSSKVSREEVLQFLPVYALESVDIPLHRTKLLIFKVLIALIKIFVRLRLGVIGYKTAVSRLNQEKVEQIYTRESKNYEWKHHLTTNSRDTWWRRTLSFDVINYIRRHRFTAKQIILLDIGTGIGLSLEEMFKVFRHFDVKVSAYGIDFNQAMLTKALGVVMPRMQKEGLLNSDRTISFLRGDGRNLTGRQKRKEGLHYFEKNSIDCITIMCGIGGIDLPYDSFQEQLDALKEEGIVTIIDIHSPLAFLSTYWPWYLSFAGNKALEFLSWQKGTIPLILREIWGWQDPTPIFYKAPLVTSYDADSKKYFGFRELHFSYLNETWWFRLPFINTARLVMEKVEIPREEYDKRVKILGSFS